MIPVETTPGIGGERIKDSSGEGELKYMFDTV
jgi:hypothetical protein